MYKAISSVYGKIRQVLLTYPDRNANQAADAEDVRQCFGGIFEALGDRVDFFVLVRMDGQEEALQKVMLDKWLLPSRHVVLLPPDYHLPHPRRQELQDGDAWASPPIKVPGHRLWAQDPFVVLSTENGQRCFLEPYHFGFQFRDAFVADQVAEKTDFLLKPTRYLLEGGNILVGDDYVLIGKNILERNYRRWFPTLSLEAATERLTEAFAEMLGMRYVIWVGLEEAFKPSKIFFPLGQEGLQPLFHLDFFLTLGGKNEHGDEIVFVAELNRANVMGVVADERELALFSAGLDAVAEQLATLDQRQPGPKFEVKRLPIGLNFVQPDTPHVYAYNNCLTEVYDGIRMVYLPSFLPEPLTGSFRTDIEQQARSAFEGAGFKVKLVRNGFQGRISQNGSLHCMTKILRRSHV